MFMIVRPSLFRDYIDEIRFSLVMERHGNFCQEFLALSFYLKIFSAEFLEIRNQGCINFYLFLFHLENVKPASLMLTHNLKSLHGYKIHSWDPLSIDVL